MNRDDIIRMAKEAGYLPLNPPSFADSLQEAFFAHFAALVAEYEREQCAAVCDRMTDLEDGWRPNTPSDCAAAIRARGNT